MATGKKYYWIKLKTSFLTSDKVDFLLSQKNGASYVVIYQMLCLKAINTNGELVSKIGEVMIPYNVEKIQRDLKHFDVDTIRVALELYKKLGMIYEQESGVIKITEFNELIGSETDYAAKKRRQRIEWGQDRDKGGDNVPIEIESRDRVIELENRFRNIFIIIKERYLEAGCCSNERIEEIEKMMIKAIKQTNSLPNDSRIQELLNVLIDERSTIANEQGYLIQCFANE